MNERGEHDRNRAEKKTRMISHRQEGNDVKGEYARWVRKLSAICNRERSAKNEHRNYRD